jgi:hypothetical protein
MSDRSKSEALEKHKGKCKCGKPKGHEGKHRNSTKDIDKVEFKKGEKVHDDEESESEEKEDNE